MSLLSLKRKASSAAKYRGHKMGRWRDNAHTSISECKRCGKWVMANNRPLPNDIPIGGPAVALGCEVAS